MATQRIDDRTLAILRDCTKVEGTTLLLTAGQLDRKQYEAVNKILENMGGKWNRKAKGHVFDYDPSMQLLETVETGLIPPKNPDAFFPTPAALADYMVDLLELERTQYADYRILEPSAGTGALAEAVSRRSNMIEAIMTLVELNPRRAAILKEKQAKGGHFLPNTQVLECDFLLVKKPLILFDGIIMNPPFAVAGDALAYITHALYAWEMLKKGGRLVGVAPTGLQYRVDRRTAQFRELVQENGWIEELEPDTFKESGTSVNTCLFIMTKPD